MTEEPSSVVEVPKMLKDLIGEDSAAMVSDEVGYYLDQARILGLKDVRPWGKEFFAIFKPPQWNIKHIETRMITNLLHYRTNYLIICSIVMAMMILSSPFLIVTALACIGVTMYFNHGLKGPIIIGETQLTAAQKAYVCVGINVFLFWVTGAAWQSIKIIIYSVGICGIHMLFRPRSITTTSNKMYEEFKLSGGFGNSWLGGGGGSHTESGDSLLDMEGGANDGEGGVFSNSSDTVRKRAK